MKTPILCNQLIQFINNLTFSSMQSYTIFQRQQITQDCCLSVPFAASQSSIPSRLMNYSSGKSQRSKQKKINLSIGKGKSQEKLRGISLTQTSNLQQSASLKAVGDKKCQSHMSTTGSKQTSQINSLKASMIRHETVLRGDKRISLKIERNGQSYPLRPNPDQITFHQTKAEITNLQLISDITMVEEEFISHGSTTLNAINCLASNDRIRSQQSTIKPYQRNKGHYQALMRGNNTVRIVSNFPMGEDQVKQFRSPLQRLAQRRRQPARKLLL